MHWTVGEKKKNLLAYTDNFRYSTLKFLRGISFDLWHNNVFRNNVWSARMVVFAKKIEFYER